MENFKKILRVFVLTLLILLALSGIGIVGALFSNNRERYRNKEITIEMVDKKEDKSENADRDQSEVKS
jgi:hypothetical protein